MEMVSIPKERFELLERCALEHADAARVLAWIENTNRPRVILAFTEGPERQIGYAVEAALMRANAEAGLCTQCESYAREIESLRLTLVRMSEQAKAVLGGRRWQP